MNKLMCGFMFLIVSHSLAANSKIMFGEVEDIRNGAPCRKYTCSSKQKLEDEGDGRTIDRLVLKDHIDSIDVNVYRILGRTVRVSISTHPDTILNGPYPSEEKIVNDIILYYSGKRFDNSCFFGVGAINSDIYPYFDCGRFMVKNKLAIMYQHFFDPANATNKSGVAYGIMFPSIFKSKGWFNQ